MIGIDPYVKLLLNFQGADAATSTLDESMVPKAVIFNGNAQLDTAQFKFGVSSLLLDGTGDYLSLSDNDDFDLGALDFTIDCFVRPNLISATHTICSHHSDLATAQRSYIMDYNATNFRFVYSTDGSAQVVAQAAYVFPTAVWTHAAITRSGNSLRFFADGAQKDATVDLTGITLFNSTQDFRIGVATNTFNNGLDGWVAAFRFSKGIARWTSNFDPPTAPYCLGPFVNNKLRPRPFAPGLAR